MKKNGKIFQQIVEFDGFILQAKVHRFRKHKAGIGIHMDFITKRCYSLLNYAYSNAKGCLKFDFA